MQKNSLVCFDFSGYQATPVFENHWFQKLKFQLSNSNIRIKHLFVLRYSWNHEIIPVEIQYKHNPIFAIQELKFKNAINFHGGMAIRISHDKKSNNLIFFGRNGLIQIGSLNEPNCKNQTFKIPKDISCAEWFFDSIRNKKFCIIGTLENVVVLDWDTKEYFKTLQNGQEHISILLVDNENQELLVCHGRTVNVWCLKTFTRLRKFPTFQSRRPSSIETIRFLNENKKWIVIGNQNGDMEIRNKNTSQLLYEKEKTDTFHFLLCSKNLLISCNTLIFTMWKVDTNEKNDIFASVVFEVKSPFNLFPEQVQFFDENQQTQLLVNDRGGNLFLIDLVSKRVTWQYKNFYNRTILNSHHLKIAQDMNL